MIYIMNKVCGNACFYLSIQRETFRRVAVVLLFLVSCPAVADVTSSRQNQLRYMVEQDCGSCHGLTRNGGLGPPLTEKALENRLPEDLFNIIRDGVKGTPMPPWERVLKDEEIRWIVKLLKGGF